MLRLPRALCVLAALALAGPAVQAQILPAPAAPEAVAPEDTAAVALDDVVVTGMRTARALEDVPVPTTVITREEIRAQGAVRLSDLLAEQPGLALVETFGGTGLQLQGFDPAYTLILVDGEPVIGREAGTLDLDRLSVAGVERVEVVRGPTSSRYGSDALAGVVNLVTRRPPAGLTAEAGGRAGSFGTSDLTAEAAFGGERLGVRALLNRYGSDGYDLRPDLGGQTAPAFTDYTAELRLDGRASGALTAALTARAGRQRQDGSFAFGPDLVSETGSRDEWSAAPRLRARLSPRLHLDASAYAARFAVASRLGFVETGEVLDDSDFEQTQAKGEAGLSLLPDARHALHAGGGLIAEGIGGSRYAGGRGTQQAFGYAEWGWQPARLFDLTLSARYDAHSDYAAQLSPKAALLVRPLERVRLRASVGRGFRAPDFRQRYLTFTNAAAGYTVLGSEELAAGLAAFEAVGGIQRYLIPPGALETIRAERSTAFNVGFEVEPVGGLVARVNGFHNEVRDLIETQAVAVKSNGQSVFSYFNLARIYTRGVETELLWTPLRALSVGAGYQWLDAADRDVLDEIAAGTVYRRAESGRDVRLARRDYGGLLGRSRHSGTLRVEGRAPRLGLTTAARLVWRSRYGDRDTNGNVVLDSPDEYVEGFGALHLTLTKTLGAATVQASARNLLDRTDAERRPDDPGRTVLVGASYRF